MDESPSATVVAPNTFMQPPASTTTVLLRVLAILGPVVVLIQEFIGGLPWKPRQEAGFLVLGLATPAVFLTLWLLLPRSLHLIRRHPDLLVPLGLLTLAEAVVGWLTLIPALGAILSPSYPFQLAALSFTVSVGAVLLIALNISYAAWTTLLILQVVRHEHPDLMTSFSESWGWFFRVLGLVFIGWSVLFAGLAVALALAPISIVLALPAIAIGALAWNLATAALLPVALNPNMGFWQSVKSGIKVSWTAKGRWWKVVVAQMLLLGWLTFIHVSYLETSSFRTTTQNTTKWAVNAFWTGGYENGCRWHGELMTALKAPRIEAITTALGVVFGGLAIAVKLRIAEVVCQPAAWSLEPDDRNWAERGQLDNDADQFRWSDEHVQTWDRPSE